MIQFKKLRLSGFKSFLYPTEIDIGLGMNGVVGPNGCGKSNLLEAMGWVMGENSAKKMRGGEMDDVIFGGTDSKPARNHAEVSVILDNSKRGAPALFNHLDEIEVTRRIERGSGSDYKINGKNVRAKDVQLLFADLVSGASSPALVSQGRITAMISAKPTDRRKILEDAAGISGLHARKHEAELKLKATANNLDRMDDLLQNMEGQLSGLKKQSRQASRYRNITAQIKEIEALIAILRWQAVQIDEQNARQQFQDFEKDIQALMSIIAEFSTQQAQQAATLPDLRRQEAEIAARLQKLMITKEQYERDIARIADEQRETAERIQDLQSDISRETQNQEQATARQTVLNAEQTDLQAQQDDDISGLDKKKTDIDVFGQDIQTREQAIDALKRALIEKESESKNLQAQKLRFEEQIAGQNREISTLKTQLERLKSALPETADLERLAKQLEAMTHDLTVKREAVQTAQTAIETAEEQRTQAENAFRQVKSDHDRLTAEQQALEKIIQSARQDSDAPPVMDHIKVQSGYENALAVALGEALDCPVEGANGEALNLYWQTLPPLSTGQKLPSDLPSLADFVENATILNRALSQIAVLDDRARGKELSQQLAVGQALVTKEGDLWRWDGLVSKAEAPSAAAIRLQQKNRLVELNAALEQQKAAVDKAEALLNQAQNAVQQARQDSQNKRQAVAEIETAIESTRQQSEQIKARQDQHRQEINAAEASISMMQANVTQAEEQKAAIMAQLANSEDLQGKRTELEQRTAELQEQRDQHRQMVQDVQRIEIETKTRLQRLESIRTELATIIDNHQNGTTRISTLQDRLQKEELRLKTLRDAPSQSPEQIAKLTDEIQKIEHMRQDATNALIAAETKLKEIEGDLRRKEQDLSDLREKRAHAQASVSSFIERRSQFEQDILEKFEVSAQELQRSLAESLPEQAQENRDSATLQSKLEKLLRERDAMGPVNLRADLEAEELEKSIEKMSNEKGELVEAIQKLRAAIQKLNKEARARLLQAFGEVDNHFQTLFTRLFRGGQAYLKLTDADDPLDAGLEIFAQPPGKKLQNLTLLSGGEQTLTSIALVFAMFLTNPSPICVLDEIDAALDDANVDRVCSLIEEISKKGETRFLIISHHRMTISRMDRLYGVTMAEKGISQLVSVDLRQTDLLDKVA